MLRTTKWKLEKVKVKVVFRLQFHATHIPQTGWDKMFVTLIPSDTGKVTAKTSKSHVRNGTCKWADPVYETTRLLQDTKTKQFDEKLYKLVVAMGSSRSGLLGEANINLADYADASKPSTVALPLNGCNSGTVIHVTVQLLTSKTGFREFEQQSELRERGFSTTTHQNVCSDPSEKLSTSTGTTNDQMKKVDSKVRLQSESSEIPSLGEVDLTEDYADSAVGIDDSSNTSESLYAEKHDSSTHENESLKSIISGDLGGIPPIHNPHLRRGEGDPSDHRNLAQGANDWVQGWSSDYSIDNDSMTAYEENSRLRGSLEMAESSILELKREMNSLQSHADELGIETQKCCQLLAKEMASGEELAKEVSGLKSECADFKDAFQQFKNSKLNSKLTCHEIISKNWIHLFQDLQMRWRQGLFNMENKVSEVQNKACDTGLERNGSFLYMDLEALQHVLQDLKQETEELTSLLNAKLKEQVDEKEIGEAVVPEPVQFLQGDKLDAVEADQYHYAGIGHCLSKPEAERQESCPLDATVPLREKISELQRELEESKIGQDSLARKLDQMECYYEAFIQELEENQKRMLGELHDLRNENSTCMLTITSCNSRMEKMQEDMSEQSLRFSKERCELESVNKELERRVISSETALRKARWNSSIAVEQLQKDLELLSFQVLSMFKTNENLIKQAFSDSSQSCLQEYPAENEEAVQSLLHKDYAEILKNQYKTTHGTQAELSASQQNEQVSGSEMTISPAKLIEEKKNVLVHDAEIHRDLYQFDLLESGNRKLQLCQNQNEELTEQLSNALKDSQRSLHLHSELYQKAETELVEMYITNTNLDVFSKVLQEVLYETHNGIRIMKEKLDALTQELAQSSESEEMLTLRLQTVLEEVGTLRAHSDCWSTKFEEVSAHNQILEENSRSMSNQNGFLRQQITEYERMIAEYERYKSQYEECTAEKMELKSLLEKETSVNGSLQAEVNSMHKELKVLKSAANEQSLVNRNLDETLSFLRDKLEYLRSMMISFNDNISGPVLHDIENKDITNIVLHLEELQNKACEKILQLTREKKDVEEQRNTAQRLLTGTESKIMLMKQRHELDMQGIVNKLVVSTDLVDQLQLELASTANKLGTCLQSEENYAAQLEETSSKLSDFTIELQNVVNENKDLAQKILGLECINEELERTKLTVIDSARENEALVLSLQSGNAEFVQLSNELGILREKIGCLSDDLNSERSLRIKLEGALAAEVKMKDDLQISFDEEKAEAIHLKHVVSDLELEKSSVCSRLLENEECLRKANENASFFGLQFTGLEAQLTALQEYFLAADVQLIYTRTQLQTRMQELVQQLESLDGCYRELHLKHLDVLTTLNGRISSEAQYVEENARLQAVLDSLKSELEANVNERADIVNRNNAICTELEQYKLKGAIAECGDIKDSRQHEHEIELLNFEELTDNLKFSRDEMEITILVLRAKLKEQCVLISTLEECSNEVMVLQNQKSELSQRLSEQILKTEEFKNISVHLKELKDKADAECLEAREKREIEVPSIALQESLRMAFIREQCETKVQELRNQLFLSKKHGEEMLLKLQDSLNEVEDLRKNEASLMRRNEELLTKILELETELQMVLADKREKVTALDKMNAELECSLISLECCKEEKQKLGDSLQECIEERTKIATELDLMKETLKTSAPPSTIRNGGDLDSSPPLTLRKDAFCREDACQVSLQGNHASESVTGVSKQIILNDDDLRQLALINEHFKAQSLKSSMGQLHEELERMKNENLVSLPLDVNQLEPVFHGLQRQLLQLRKANEQLGSIFPLFNEFPGSGNAMERVLALEIELAEALQAKKQTNIHFQSSFLKQHADEEAVFQSFRDINELIKDMLELKGRYVAVETELKEMHDRYSELSLQFAEVEGERQKLVMTLKNARSPRKTSSLHRSTSASLEDHS